MKYLKTYELFEESFKIRDIDISDNDIKKIMNSYLSTAIFMDEEKIRDSEEYEHIYGTYDNDEDDRGIEDLVNSLNFDENSEIEAYDDIKKFLYSLSDEELYSVLGDRTLETLAEVGTNIWLSRNEYGNGFHDKNIDQKARQLGKKTSYLDFDGKMYFDIG